MSGPFQDANPLQGHDSKQPQAPSQLYRSRGSQVSGELMTESSMKNLVSTMSFDHILPVPGGGGGHTVFLFGSFPLGVHFTLVAPQKVAP